jgi:hypothetical protein
LKRFRLMHPCWWELNMSPPWRVKWKVRQRECLLMAGGPAGLMDFALRPQVAATARLAGGTTAWQGPALQGVSRLSDFAMIVLITDDHDTGRTWLEQIQPRTANDLPLMLVSSAQAAPVLSAYMDGRQIDGMVTGLAGGTIYEQLIQRPGLSAGRWQAFQLAMIVSLAVILIGAVADLVMRYLAARKAKTEV